MRFISVQFAKKEKERMNVEGFSINWGKVILGIVLITAFALAIVGLLSLVPSSDNQVAVDWSDSTAPPPPTEKLAVDWSDFKAPPPGCDPRDPKCTPCPPRNPYCKPHSVAVDWSDLKAPAPPKDPNDGSGQLAVDWSDRQPKG